VERFQGGDEVSEAEEDEEVGIDKEDQELIKQQNKLAEEINDLEDAVKRKRVEVQGKQNRTLRVSAGM
jgi:TATA-binding protein-associated factor Taf7